jgi:hypothetical protein
VEENHDTERYRLCFDRLKEFCKFVGLSLRVSDLRPSHVERWLASKSSVTALRTFPATDDR